MKVLQVNDYGFRIGGAEQYCFTISEQLKKLGHEVQTVSSNRNSSGTLFESNSQIMQSGHIFNIDQIFNPINFFQFKKILKKFKPDVIHFHNVFYALSPSVIFAAASYPTVLTLHDYQIICSGDKRLVNGEICNSAYKCCRQGCLQMNNSTHEKIRRKIMNAAILNIKTFISPSRYLHQEFINNSINNVVYLEHPRSFQEVKLGSNVRKDFLYLGRLAEQKGLDLLIDAFLELKDLQTKLQIAGVGPELEKLKAKVIRHNAEERIIFHGFISGDKKKKLLESCIANILPSLWPEVAPISLKEAASLGTPSIVSSAGGLPELVQHEITGLVFDRNNKDSLKTQILYAVNNMDKLQKFGEQAAEYASQYSLESHVNDLIKVYQKII